MKSLKGAAIAALVLPGLISCEKRTSDIGNLDKAGIIATVERLGAAQKRSDINAELALKVAGLSEHGEYHWDSRTGENGNYVFTNLGFGEANARIERLTLNGLHMRDTAGPYVDSIIIEGLNSEQDDGLWVQKLEKGQIHFGENYWGNFGSFDASLISPFESLRILVEQILQGGGNSAAYFEGLSLNINLDLKAEAEFMGWVPGAETGELSFFLDDVDYAMTMLDPDSEMAGAREETVRFSVDTMTGKNLDLEALNPQQALDFDLVGMNPFDTSLDQLTINNLDLLFDGLTLDIATLTSSVDGNVKGKFSRGTEIPALYLAFKQTPQNPSLRSLYDIFQGMGMDQWEFSYRSKLNLDVKRDRASVDEMRLVMKDGAELKLAYDVVGFHNYGMVMQSMREKLENARKGDEVVDFESFQAQINAALSEMTLDRLELYLDDNSLLEKTLNTMAVNQDVSLDVARQQVKAYAMLMTLGVDDPYLSTLAEDFATSAQSFVLEGGGLKFSVDPDDGFKLGAAVIAAERDKNASVQDLYGPLNADFEHIPD